MVLRITDYCSLYLTTGIMWAGCSGQWHFNAGGEEQYSLQALDRDGLYTGAPCVEYRSNILWAQQTFQKVLSHEKLTIKLRDLCHFKMLAFLHCSVFIYSTDWIGQNGV